MVSKVWLDARLSLLESADTAASRDFAHDHWVPSPDTPLEIPGLQARRPSDPRLKELSKTVRPPPGLSRMETDQLTSFDTGLTYQPSLPASLDTEENTRTGQEAWTAGIHGSMSPMQQPDGYRANTFTNVLQSVLAGAHDVKKLHESTDTQAEFSMGNKKAVFNINAERGIICAKTLNTLWHACFSCQLLEHNLRVIILRVDGRPSGAGSPDLSEAETRRDASLTDLLVRFQGFRVPVVGIARGDISGFGSAVLSCCDCVLVHSCARICFGRTGQDQRNTELAWALPLLLSERVGSREADALVADEWPKSLEELMQLGFITDVAKTDAELDCMEKMLIREFSNCDFNGVQMLKSALGRPGDRRSPQFVPPRGSGMSQSSETTTTSFSQASQSQSQISSEFALSTASTWAGRSGGEAETTLMICNLPCSLTLEGLAAAIDGMGFRRRYDFLHLPCCDGKDDARRKSNAGYGFINLLDTSEVKRFRDAFEGYSFEEFNSEKKVTIRVADRQQRSAKVKSSKKKRITLMK